jgi:hypothetical protein
MPAMKRSVSEAVCPTLPAGLVGESAAAGLLLRPFGSDVDDLSVDFRQRAPYVVTDVLACCARRPDGSRLPPDLLWELSLSARTLYFVLLAGMAEQPPFAVRLRCPQPACRQAIEIDVSVAEVIERAGGVAEGPIHASAGGASLRLRRPTGADQAGWLEQAFGDEEEACTAILRSLIVEAPAALPPGWQSAAEAKLDAADPLVRFNISVVCPDCETESDLDVPLTAVALERLKRAQTALIESVHVLAAHYGWSEAQVVSLSPWRREGYVSLVERDRRS